MLLSIREAHAVPDNTGWEPTVMGVQSLLSSNTDAAGWRTSQTHLAYSAGSASSFHSFTHTDAGVGQRG